MIITIDGKTVNAKEGWTILRAARENGFKIPSLCHNDQLEPFSSCFVCLVEVQGAKGFIPACSTQVAKGMEIKITSEAAWNARKKSLELLASDHSGDCEPPCQTACPAHVHIRDFVALVADDRPVEAAKKVRETLPFPGSLGRVCPRFCQAVCRRKAVEESVSICFLKRFASDEELRAGGPFMPESKKSTGKKVAIIGAGPAGLTAAYFLRLEGHAVTVFEKHDQPGGMLKWGIPDYRLPPAILKKECDAILKLGVETRYGVTIGKDVSLENLRKEYDTILIAIGAQKASDMPIEGDAAVIRPGINFLEEVAKGQRPDIGSHAVVVGGGNTAMDAARSAIRLGAKVTVLYRRTKDEMPASSWEIEEAEQEGVHFQYLAAPVKITKTAQGIELACIQMELGEPDKSGRRRPVPKTGSEFTLQASTCIAAIGQQMDAGLAKDSNLELTRWGTLTTNPATLQTNVPEIFAAGDCSTGADVAVRAIAAGRKAAVAMNQFLSGEKVTGEPYKFNSTMSAPEKIEGYEIKPAAKMPTLEPSIRSKTFSEAELGFAANIAKEEAARCLSCGCAKADDCRLREYCSEYQVDQTRFAGNRRAPEIDNSHPQAVLESGKCINCGVCVRLLEKEGSSALGFVNRGFETRIKPPFNRTLADSAKTTDLTAAIEACPTAGLREKIRQSGLSK